MNLVSIAFQSFSVETELCCQCGRAFSDNGDVHRDQDGQPPKPFHYKTVCTVLSVGAGCCPEAKTSCLSRDLSIN